MHGEDCSGKVESAVIPFQWKDIVVYEQMKIPDFDVEDQHWYDGKWKVPTWATHKFDSAKSWSQIDFIATDKARWVGNAQEISCVGAGCSPEILSQQFKQEKHFNHKWSTTATKNRFEVLGEICKEDDAPSTTEQAMEASENNGAEEKPSDGLEEDEMKLLAPWQRKVRQKQK